MTSNEFDIIKTHIEFASECDTLQELKIIYLELRGNIMPIMRESEFTAVIDQWEHKINYAALLQCQKSEINIISIKREARLVLEWLHKYFESNRE